MKRIAAALMVLAVIACSKEGGEGDVAPGSPCEVQISITGEPLSKAVDNTPANESRVNHLQILVFDSDGLIENYKDAGAAISTSLLTTTGKKDIWCLVNYPLVGDVKTRDELLSLTTKLSDNRLDGFVMTGHLEADLRDSDVVSVTVRRMVSKVTIKSISTRFESGAVSSLPFRLVSIYMVNVSSEVDLGLQKGVLNWANKLGREDMELDYLLYDSVDRTISAEYPYVADHAFYVYPNEVSDITTSPVWSPRNTMLAIEVEIDGEKGWYTIVIPKVERNVEYIIRELVITRRPSEEPFIPVEQGSPIVGVNVLDWELGLNLGKIVI